MNAVHIRKAGQAYGCGNTLVTTICGLKRNLYSTVEFPDDVKGFIRGNSLLCMGCAQSALRRHPKAEEVSVP